MNRNALGLDDFPFPTDKRQDEAFAALPAVGPCLGSRASSPDITDGRQENLGMVFDSGTVSDVASHSLKTALFTYVNIFWHRPN